MPLDRLIATKYLQATNSGRDTSFYKYEFNTEVLPDRVVVADGNCLERNLSLRTALNGIWMQEPDRRFEVGSYYVRRWGGIGGNKQTTLERYIRLLGDGEIPLKQGIASWSKIATVSDPSRFAIFDARVSAALNCIQLRNQSLEYSFPQLETQNGAVKRFNGRWRAAGHARGLPHDSDFYRRYLECIQGASKLAKTSIQHIEMFLFSISLDEIPPAIELL